MFFCVLEAFTVIPQNIFPAECEMQSVRAREDEYTHSSSDNFCL